MMIALCESFCIGAEVVTPGVGVLAYPCWAVHTALKMVHFSCAMHSANFCATEMVHYAHYAMHTAIRHCTA